jgi:hypothetical protein
MPRKIPDSKSPATCKRGATNVRERRYGKIVAAPRAGSPYPTDARFVSPKIVLDDQTRAMLQAIPPAERHAYRGYTVTVARLVGGSYIDADELAAILEHNQHRPIPPAIQQYRDALASGMVKKRRGRYPPTNFDTTWLALAEWDMRQFQSWLERRHKRYGRVPSWSFVRQAPWWKPGPYEFAAAMVRLIYYPYLDEKVVQNYISKVRNPRPAKRPPELL